MDQATYYIQGPDGLNNIAGAVKSQLSVIVRTRDFLKFSLRTTFQLYDDDSGERGFNV